MIPDPASPLVPGADHQLLHLAVAAATAVAASLAGSVGAALRRRRSGAPAAPARSGWAQPGRRLVGALVLALVILPLAASLRQLWPHPGLRDQALVVLVAAVAWAAVGWWRTTRREDDA